MTENKPDGNFPSNLVPEFISRSLSHLGYVASWAKTLLPHIHQELEYRLRVPKKIDTEAQRLASAFTSDFFDFIKEPASKLSPIRPTKGQIRVLFNLLQGMDEGSFTLRHTSRFCDKLDKKPSLCFYYRSGALYGPQGQNYFLLFFNPERQFPIAAFTSGTTSEGEGTSVVDYLIFPEKPKDVSEVQLAFGVSPKDAKLQIFVSPDQDKITFQKVTTKGNEDTQTVEQFHLLGCFYGQTFGKTCCLYACNPENTVRKVLSHASDRVTVGQLAQKTVPIRTDIP